MSFVKLTGCSFDCAYATTDRGRCTCKCGGERHGSLVQRPERKEVKCSRGHEKRCKEGTEGTECHCACGGINHGLYSHVDMSKVRITSFEDYQHA